MKSLAAGIAVLLVLGGAIFLQRETNRQLQREIDSLRSDVQNLAHARAGMGSELGKGAVLSASPSPREAGMDRDRSEIVQLRETVARLEKTTQDLTRAAQAPSKTDSVPLNLVPLSAWKNAGRASARATVETVLWAATAGQVETVAESIDFTDSGRAKAEALWAQVSDATRAQYGTPEKLLALLIARDAASVTGMQVLGQRDMSADEVGMRVRLANDEGKTKEDSFLFHRGSDETWKLRLTDATVDRFARSIHGGP